MHNLRKGIEGDSLTQVLADIIIHRNHIKGTGPIQGLTPAQIQSKFALPNTPTHYCFVSVPKGTEMYAGIVGENYGYTAGQAVQFELGTNIPTESFGAGIPLP